MGSWHEHTDRCLREDYILAAPLSTFCTANAMVSNTSLRDAEENLRCRRHIGDMAIAYAEAPGQRKYRHAAQQGYRQDNGKRYGSADNQQIALLSSSAAGDCAE